MLFLETVLHSKKLSYERLIPLVKEYISTHNKSNSFGDTVNVFIDVYDVLKPLYMPQNLEVLGTLKVDERYMISSEIINIVSHYRHFFYSRFNMFSNIYFYYSDKPSSYHTSINSEYKEDFYSKRLDLNNVPFSVLNKIIKNNIPLINTFMEYVPHAYFINTGSLEYTLLPSYIISNYVNEKDLNMIVSNEKIMFQDLLLNDNTIQLDIRGEKSRIITTDNTYDVLLEKTKKSSMDYTIIPDLLNVIQSLSGYKKYNIKGIKNMSYGRSMNFIQKNLDNGLINNIQYSDPNILKSIFDNDEDFLKFYENFKLIDHNTILNSNRYDLVVNKQLIDKVDAKSVRYINDKYFAKHPILIEYCFEGEEYI